MADTLEALELKITHNSGGAAGALKEVTSALTSLLPVITDVNTKVHSLAIGLQNIGGIKALGQAVKATTGSVKELANSMKAVGTETKSVSASRFTTLHKTLRDVKAQIRDLDAEQRKNSGLPGGSYASIMAGSVNPANGLTGAQLQALNEKLAGTTTEAVKASTSMKEVAKETITAANAVQAFNLGDKIAATNDQIAACTQKLVDLDAKISGESDPAKKNKYLEQFANLEQRYISLQNKLGKEQDAEGGSRGIGFFSGIRKSISQMFGMVSRIIMRRVITSAIRAVAKAFKEGYTNLYKWSQALGGQFAKDMDKASASMMQLKNSLAGAVAPALQALVPIIQTVCSWIATLMSYVSMFFAAISGLTSFYTALTQDANDYAKAAGGAGKANKDLLASFDELNVIQSESGGGGGGGGGNVNNMFREDTLEDGIRNKLARIGKVVSGAGLALGAILTFAGSPMIGIPLMAIGAASLVGAIKLDWSTATNKVESVIHSIETVLGTALLAVGGVLTFSGANVPLGLALMAAGAVNLASAIVPSLNISEDLKKTIMTISAILEGAMLVIGAVLTFTGANLPLGLGLMAAGAVGLAAQVAANWDTIVQKISEVYEKIKWYLIGGALVIGAVLTFSGASIPIGIGLMAAGAAGLAAEVAVNWDAILNKIKSVYDAIKGYLIGGSLVIGAVLAFSGVNIPLGIGLMAAGAVGLATEVAANWNTIKEKVSSILTAIGDIVKKSMLPIGVILTLFGQFAIGIPLIIAGLHFKAQDAGVEGGLLSEISWGLQQVGKWFDTYVVTPIKGFFNSVSAWWGEHITEPAKKAFAAVSDWWTTNISEPISRSFESIKTWWNTNVAEPIRDSIAAISVWWEANISKPVSKAIETIGTWWTKYVSGPVGKFIDTIKGYIDRFKPAFDEKLAPVIESIGKWWNTYVAGPIATVYKTIVGIINTLKEWLGIRGTKYIDIVTVEPGTKNANGGGGGKSDGSGGSYIWGINGGLGGGGDVHGINGSNLADKLKISAKAGGGFIRTGQLFIAGENGIPEMIGSFGGNNAVANNDMIVTGIRQGVRDAMTEQNALLRQQNEYLSALLDKRIVAEVKPSAAMGKINAQSAAMYARVTGG